MMKLLSSSVLSFLCGFLIHIPQSIKNLSGKQLYVSESDKIVFSEIDCYLFS